jgi:DNA-binding NarL/FixJ family response regulator
MPELPTTPADERSEPLRVLLVDDSADLANMLARWMRSQPGLEVVGVLGSAAGLAEEVVSREADVVMLDLVMPGPPPLEAIRGILARAPRCRVLVFSGYDDAETRGQALAAGAHDLVSKNLSPREIVEAIRRAGVASGGGA